MHRETKLVLTVLLLVVVPTAILSLVAAWNLRAWEIVQEKRIEQAAGVALRSVTARASADLEQTCESLLADVRSAGGAASREALLPVAAEFRTSHPLAAGIFVFRVPAALVYPFPASVPSDRDSRRRWAEILTRISDATLLDSVQESFIQSAKPEDALQECGRFVKREDLPPEMRWEAALGMAQCRRRTGQSGLAAEGLLGMLRESPAASVASAGAFGREPRDEEGYLYRLQALRDLCELYRQAHDRARADDATLTLYAELVRDYGRVVRPQREELRRYVAAGVEANRLSGSNRTGEVDRLNRTWDELVGLD